MKEMNMNFEKVAPIAFGYERETDFSKQVSKAIKAFYLQDKPLDKTQIANLAQVCILIFSMEVRKTLRLVDFFFS